jgi:hypothetical protein
LKKDANGNPVFNIPLDDPIRCDSQADYDPIYNPMCWEFYNKAGNKSYGFYYNTVTCSENCHPYRSTNIPTEDCARANGENIDGACVYMAIPNEGEKCAARDAGCRKYVGNQGNNTRVVGFYTFDNNTTEGWEAVSGEIYPSNTSLSLQSKSMLINGEAKIKLGHNIRQGSAYILSFLAKSNGGSGIELYLQNNNNEKVNFKSVSIPNEWAWFEEIELSDPETGINFIIDDETALYIKGNLFIDNIKITEVTGWHYLIKYSWQTPSTCLPSMLGCDEYKNIKRSASLFNERRQYLS